MKHKKWPKGLLALVILGILAFFIIPRVQPSSADEQDKKGEKQKSPAIPVYAKAVKHTELSNTFTTTGTVIPGQDVALQTESAGKITQLPLKEGQKVQKGELLVRINDSELQARLQQAKHRQKLLEQQVERKRKLLAKNGISQESFDETKTELESLKSEVAMINAQIAKKQLRAPFDGTVGLKQVHLGSYVSLQTTVAKLVQKQPVKIDFSIPGKYADDVAEGQTISFRVNGRDSNLKARIYAIEPSIDPSTRTLQIRAMYPNEQEKITPGSFAEVKLNLSKTDQAVMIPSIAVIAELQGKKVFVYRNGKSYPQKIKTGKRTKSMVEVTEGLSPGDTVITKGIQKVRPGAAVKIKAMNNEN